MEEKICSQCAARKPVSDFYATGKGGVAGKCKDCTKAAARENRRKRIGYYREYDRNRYKDGGHRYAQGPSKEASDRAKRNYAARNPAKRKAHHAVSNAIRDGKLKKQPCCVCGEPKAQAHHEDYSQPLAVVWLCSKHHSEHHLIIDRFAQVMAEQESRA